jgi:hypothetical protein
MNIRLARYSNFAECHSEEQSDEKSRRGWRREILHSHYSGGLQIISRQAPSSRSFALSRFSISFLHLISLSLFLSVCLPSWVFAGHGFTSAFTNIAWLPDPGRTPDSALYRLDAAREEGQLLFAQTNAAKVRLCLTFAREKLAELDAMVKAEKVEAAKVAAERYRLYVDRAQQLTVGSTNDKEVLADTLANALLEHQYILSVIYEELPVSARSLVPEVIAAAQERYLEVTKLLSPKKKGALFFKEEEVRWSVQMATRAEEDSSQ